MAQVLLRDYTEKMREHLRAGRYSDATALGHHILRYYPKHLETYRLLAEISLETDDLAAAADLFQRVRSADPENVVALVGLAIVHEHRKQLAEAVWHLERAFEIQPTNAELRKELQRLYAAHEGKPRPRLKLTPAALARLYARQGLYPQAIQELRTLLRADPTRFDLQVALAETLYREGRKKEAAEIAQALLDKLPYCLKANLLLGAIWAENEVPEAQPLLQRAQALDPERLVARDLQVDHWEEASPPMVPDAREGLAPAAGLTLDLGTGPARELFGLEDRTALTPPAAPGPEPTILASLQEEKTTEPLPSARAPAPAAPPAAPAVEQPSAQEQIKPEAERPTAPIEGKPTTESKPLPVNPALPKTAPTLPSALEKLPAWLRIALGKTAPTPIPPAAAFKPEPPRPSLAQPTPPRVVAEPPKPTPASAVTETPEPAAPPITPAPPAKVEPLDWRTRIRQGSRRGEPDASTGAATEPEYKAPWLIESEQQATAPAESVIPDWLGVDSTSVEPPAAPAGTETGLPEWLSISETAKQAETPPAENLPGTEATPKSQLEAGAPTMNWLEQLPEAAAPIETPAPDTSIPNWLAGWTEEKVEPEIPASASTSPTWSESLAEAQIETPAPETAIPSWLDGLPGGAEFEASAAPEASAPSWLEGLPGGTEFETPTAATAETSVPSVSEGLTENRAGAETPAPETAVPSWLDGLPGSAEFEASAVPEALAPSWLEGLPGGTEFETPAAPAPEPSVPHWLEGLTEAEAEAPAPDWPETPPSTAQSQAPAGLASESATVEPLDEIEGAAPVSEWLLAPSAEASEMASAEPTLTAPDAPLAAEPGIKETEPLTPTSQAAVPELALESPSLAQVAAPQPSAVEPAPAEIISAAPTAPIEEPTLPEIAPAESPHAESAAPAPQAAAPEMPVAQVTAEIAAPAFQETATQPAAPEPAVVTTRVEPDIPAPEAKAPEPAVAQAIPAEPPVSEPVVPEPPKPRAVDPETLLVQARELRSNGNYISAIDTYEKVLQRGPRLIPAVIKDLEELVVEKSAPLSTHRLLGDAYSMAGRFKEALAQYRMVLGR